MISDQDAEGARRRPFQVGEWWFEPDLDRISRGDEHRTLRPRVSELLAALADRPGELALKHELVDAVWQSGYVTDNALAHLVTELRGALGDDAAHPSYVETIFRRGYRLVAPVVHSDASPASPTPPVRFQLENEAGTLTDLTEGENLIGRSPEAVVRVDSSEASRRHARILIRGAVAELEDLGSKNGTYLRGRRLTARARLEVADEIQIGINVATFRLRSLDDSTRTEDPDAPP
jgi:DNA-binding winged helix-turn-helix (wHTH) protein